jgi:hypothetical protein
LPRPAPGGRWHGLVSTPRAPPLIEAEGPPSGPPARRPRRSAPGPGHFHHRTPLEYGALLLRLVAVYVVTVVVLQQLRSPVDLAFPLLDELPNCNQIGSGPDGSAFRPGCGWTHSRSAMSRRTGIRHRPGRWAAPVSGCVRDTLAQLELQRACVGTGILTPVAEEDPLRRQVIHFPHLPRKFSSPVSRAGADLPESLARPENPSSAASSRAAPRR